MDAALGGGGNRGLELSKTSALCGLSLLGVLDVAVANEQTGLDSRLLLQNALVELRGGGGASVGALARNFIAAIATIWNST